MLGHQLELRAEPLPAQVSAGAKIHRLVHADVNPPGAEHPFQAGEHFPDEGVCFITSHHQGGRSVPHGQGIIPLRCV